MRKRGAAAGRRRRWTWIVGGTVALAGGLVAALVFQPWLALIDVQVDDEIPVAVSTPQQPLAGADPSPSRDESPAASASASPPAPPSGPVDLLSGTFISHEHETSGSARIIENADGTRQLAIENLATTNGPDVHVWLSAGPVIEGFDGWFTAGQNEFVDLGPIKGNLGNQLYDIPPEIDLDVFRTVDLWCVQFSVSFGAAALG
ncbi:DM13 domain-containing protein [Microbacterium sp. ET2]|uniref:DM13 domain-containing protein n=1 Tax=Microbacterium albipurpureum TaxID=3050384 RepID=UPI00259C7282|nr:DM13 domain-containing protein [Microbacterium sp. ET2 (Ac-2212)]WJL96234.1 DM13 domain-containing protein [Microbacterium sp. ET2 (Ac-2212)]